METNPIAGCKQFIYPRKTCELLISLAFIIACCYEQYRQIKAYGWKLQWRFFAIVFMASSLLGTLFTNQVNIAFCLWNNIYTLYSL